MHKNAKRYYTKALFDDIIYSVQYSFSQFGRERPAGSAVYFASEVAHWKKLALST